MVLIVPFVKWSVKEKMKKRFRQCFSARVRIRLGRLWGAGTSPPLIGGLYLVLAGLARFVEESYRGEPQTPTVRGLHLYQWFALLSVGSGVVMMSWRTLSQLPTPDPSWAALGAGVTAGLACWFAMGVDFPASNRRFARLA
jgi:hypothetical protein